MTVALARNRFIPAAVGLGSLFVFVVLIEVLIRAGLINRFIVPMPSEIIAAFPRVITEENGRKEFADAVKWIERHDGAGGGLIKGILVPREMETCSIDLLRARARLGSAPYRRCPPG